MSLHGFLEVIGASTVLIVSLVYFGALYYDITKMILTEISKHSIFLREVNKRK